jgi:hypothetical protein
MTTANSVRPTDERARARVGDLRQVLRQVRSRDVRDTIEAAIADVEERHGFISTRLDFALAHKSADGRSADNPTRQRAR